MTSIPAFVRNRFRLVGAGANGPRPASGPGVAVLVDGEPANGQPVRFLEVIAAGDDVYGVAADLVAGHLKSCPGATVHAQVALIPDAGERARTVRELDAHCARHAYKEG